MLDDRSYMRNQPSDFKGTATFKLLIALVVAFFLQSFVMHYVPRGRAFIEEYFFLSKSGLSHGFLWQLFTYQFLHGGLMHLLLNGFAIYFFGRALEESVGTRRFLTLYFTAGVAGGIFQILGAFLWPQAFDGPVVGASAGAYGLLAAFAGLFPERHLTLLLFFIIPVTLKAKYLLLGLVLVATYGIIFPGDHIAHLAHMGGLIAGLYYVRTIIQSPQSPSGGGAWSLVQRWFKQPPRKPPPRIAPPAAPGRFISHEVDPILDKISAHGIQSLTDEERRILEAARAKMQKR